MLDDLDGIVFFAQTKQFQVAKSSLLGLGFSCVSVDLDTEVITLVLPVKLALYVRK